MAEPITKYTSVVDVTLADSTGGETTLHLNDPTDNLTLAVIKSAFANFFAGTNTSNKHILFNRSGYPFTGVSSAKIVETAVTTEYLE